MTYASATGNFTIALGGDCMLTRKLSIHDEPHFLALRDIFRNADAGFANLETVVRNRDEGTPGITRGTYMTTPPELLSELGWFGVNLVGTANNHACDFGEAGLVASLGHLQAAGIVQAGAGRNLAEARRPGYLDTKAGRVALIATTATYRPWNAASDQRPDMPGRPGINTFGSKDSWVVDAATFEALQRMNRELGFEATKSRDRGHFYSAAEAKEDTAEELELFGERIVKGRGFDASSAGIKADIEDNLRWIREARRSADWVVVSFHSHEFAHSSRIAAKTRAELAKPADYIPDFARAAIDAGADIFVGHGSHTPLGLELYKGKPILHSVGNFIFQNETVPQFPDEAYRRFGLGYDATPADFLDARTGGGTKGHVAHREFWENIVASVSFDRGKLAQIRIHPIEHGFNSPRGQRGRPMLASGETASRIVARIADLSRPYGVEVKDVEGVGVVRV